MLIGAVVVVGVLCLIDLLLTFGVIRRLREHTTMLAGFQPGGDRVTGLAAGGTPAAFTATDATSATTLTPKPNAPAPPPSADSTVVPSNAKPPVANNNKLRPRARNGSGRSLRGTVQAVFIAFCNACAPPSPP